MGLSFFKKLKKSFKRGGAVHHLFSKKGIVGKQFTAKSDVAKAFKKGGVVHHAFSRKGSIGKQFTKKQAEKNFRAIARAGRKTLDFVEKEATKIAKIPLAGIGGQTGLIVIGLVAIGGILVLRETRK